MPEKLVKKVSVQLKKSADFFDIQDRAKEKTYKIINLNKETNKELLNVVFKTRILNLLLLWNKKERIEKQIVFFAHICTNIFTESSENWKKDISCKYIINRYKSGKYDSLMQLYRRNKPIWEDVLSFFIDEFLSNLNLLKWILDFKNNKVTQKEIFESQISRLNWSEQRVFLEILFKNLKKEDNIKDWLMKSIVKLVWWWEKQERKTKRKWYKKYLMYEGQWKNKYIKLYPYIISKLSDRLINRPELQKWIFNQRTFIVSSKIKKEKQEDKYIIPDEIIYRTQKYKLIKNLLSWNRQEKIEKQKTFFTNVWKHILEKKKDLFTTISKYLWKKECNISFSLRRLLKWTHPINENNLYLIIERLFSINPKFEDIFNLRGITISKNDVLSCWISRKTNEKQIKFLTFVYQKISSSEKYKNIINKRWWGIAATIKDFINPLRYKFSERCMRQKIKDTLYVKQKKIDKDILDLLIIRLLEEKELFFYKDLILEIFDTERSLFNEKLKKDRLEMFKTLYEKKKVFEEIWFNIENEMYVSDYEISEEVRLIKERIWREF